MNRSIPAISSVGQTNPTLADAARLHRAKITLGRLDRGVAKQELDLLDIPVILAAELGAGTPEVMRPEPLDPDLLLGSTT